MSELFSPLFGGDAVDAATDDRAWLTALCETEAALARACARLGLVDIDTALEVARACAQVARRDPAALGRRAAADGNPVIPLVAVLRETVEPHAAAAVHLGATSQDVLDTAMMIVSRRALGVLLRDLDGCATAAAELARTHRDTPMVGRTLLQAAVPTTFGALAAVWGAGLDRAAERLRDLRGRLPAQLGGAAGTLAAHHPHGLRLLAEFAEEVDLAEPAGVWHTERGIVAELAGALGQAAAATAKPAQDVVLLAQQEVGEVREQAPGGSSAMPHKQNPIAAVTALASAAQAPGLVATLLAAWPELQRGAGGWHAEWPALIGLLRAAGGAAARLHTSLSGLAVDTAAMGRNLAHAGYGSDGGADTGHAGELVDRYLRGRRS